MEVLKSVLKLLFEPDEEVCVSDCKGGYHSMPQSSILSGEVTLVSPKQHKPIRKVKTENLNMLCINAIKGWRRDESVTSCRSFLFEIDTGKLSAQLAYVKSLGLPYSSATYSGGKSIHFLTVLDQPVDEKTWRLLFRWTCNIGTLLDDQNSNPTRNVRIPGAIRPDTGKRQELIEIKSRVKLEDFMTWLYKYPHLRPKSREERKVLTGEEDYGKLSRWLRKALKENSLDFSKGRNARWYSVFFDFAQAGYAQEEAESILENFFSEDHDFKRNEWLSCAKSAYDHVYRK